MEFRHLDGYGAQADRRAHQLVELKSLRLGMMRLFLEERVVRPEVVLEFWFPELGEHVCPEPVAERWFRKSSAFDSEIRARFEPLIGAIPPDWASTPQGRMAAILVLDQFPRNLYRSEARQFAHDDEARALCLEGLARGHDKALALEQRTFFYLPLEHSEERGHQELSLSLYAELVELAPPEHKSRFENYLDYARRHAEIIFRFGRYPHRNALLARKSTPEEEEFLRQPGSSFL